MVIGIPKLARSQLFIKMNLDVDLIPIAKLTQSGLYLNIRHKTIELLKENSRGKSRHPWVW